MTVQMAAYRTAEAVELNVEARPLDESRARKLLAWGERALRDMPWRRTRDPWAILVAELMLQQTQVSRVVDRYQQFLAQFPTPEACAAAPVAAVLRAWEGLGYNRRALHLHRAATLTLERHDGVLPDNLDDLLALPGVGPYTARAVLVFAHERHHGVVDTNAARFLARAVAGARLSAKQAQQLADAQVPEGESWAFNQAVLDLGATICTKRAPNCGVCPISSACAWHQEGCAGGDPAHGSAGTTTPQSRFDGSDRQGRGRLVQALRQGPIGADTVAAVAGWPDDATRAQRVADGLVAEGLAVYDAGQMRLPS